MTGPKSRLRAATLDDVTFADREWDKQRRASDTHGWKWEPVLRFKNDCLYTLGSPTFPVAALIGIQGKPLMLTTPTRRLNYFQIAPDLRGTGFARIAIAIFARFSLELKTPRMVICALPAEKVLKFYEDLGGVVGAPVGWESPKGLVPITIEIATMKELGEVADAFEETEP